MANNGNQQNRYGAVARAIGPFSTGLIFIVKSSSDPDYTDVTYEFPSDLNGTTRVYSTLLAAAGATVANRGDVVICPKGLITAAGLAALATGSMLNVDGGLSNGGSEFIFKKTLTSSGIGTAAADLSLLAYGEVEIKQVILKTDGTGLAGGTNFKIITNNAKGPAIVAQETVANLGANVLVTTPSVTNAVPTVIENGKKLQQQSTVANCTGAGTVDVYLVCERVTSGAYLMNA